MYIQIEIYEERVKKKYLPDPSRPGLQEEKFYREINAYKFFNNRNIKFVPKLLSYDESFHILNIQKVDGNDICSTLDDCTNDDMQNIISQLTLIDTFLFKNKINYMYSSPADIIYDKVRNKLFIIDFEYTFLNEYFQQILYKNMFHSRMNRVKNTVSRDLFLKKIRTQRKKFIYYNYRRVKNFLLNRLGLIRQKEKGKI